ncbi:hypothetical protein ABT168_14375 [Streptomyces sp. NPDC001793]|uniref:hypothetical protein n=1 Tax=Streptomyces sp. NPDC001793 TaxID=3154657 RepID=UPI003332F093
MSEGPVDTWTAKDVAGVVLILLGNLVMVANPAPLRRLTGRPAPEPEPQPSGARTGHRPARPPGEQREFGDRT